MDNRNSAVAGRRVAAEAAIAAVPVAKAGVAAVKATAAKAESANALSSSQIVFRTCTPPPSVQPVKNLAALTRLSPFHLASRCKMTEQHLKATALTFFFYVFALTHSKQNS